MPLRIKKTLKIKGMTCTQCEKIIRKKLLAQEGVSVADVSFRTSTANLVFDSMLTNEQVLRKVIERAGYEVEDVKSGTKSGAWPPMQLAGIGILIAAVYVLIKQTIGFNFIPAIQPSMGYGMLFVVGLLTSLHCIAMCGGINLSQCMVPQKDGTRTAGMLPSLLYNGGRVISYTVVGGIVGGLGSVVSFSGSARGFVAILAGAFMMIMGINMLGIIPGLRRFQIKMPEGLRTKLLGTGGERGPLVVGLINGFMPCGPLQAMQLYALGTGSLLAGALSMFVFSLGTVPLMFGFGALSTLLSKKFTKNMLKVSAILVILLGFIMLQRGLSLGGLSLGGQRVAVSPDAALGSTLDVSAQSGLEAKAGIGLEAKVANGVQTVQGEVEASAYPEIVVRKGIPVQFNLHADAANLNGCNGSIVIPEYNVQMELKPGDNIIKFTPEKTGTYGYTCWMGMISSKITVID